jgi:hypothetical protein
MERAIKQLRLTRQLKGLSQKVKQEVVRQYLQKNVTMAPRTRLTSNQVRKRLYEMLNSLSNSNNNTATSKRNNLAKDNVLDAFGRSHWYHWNLHKNGNIKM